MEVAQTEALNQQARQALAQGNAGQAKQLFRQALEVDADKPELHFGLATALFLLNELPAAVEHFRQVTRLDPRHVGAYVNLGAIYNRLNQLDDAITVLRKSIQLNSRRAEAYYNLGLAYRRKGQSELAIQAYKEATNLNPRMLDAHYNLARLYLELSRFSPAMLHYRKALDINPNFENAAAGLREAEAGQKAAEAHLHRDIEFTPPTTVDRPEAQGLVSTVDPMEDAPRLSALHKAVIHSENLSTSFVRVLEREVEPAVKELSSVLLYPEKSGAELSGRIHVFEVAMQNVLSMQREFQSVMKRLRKLNDQLMQHRQQQTAAKGTQN